MFEKPEKEKDVEELIPDCFARTYGVELFYEDKPSFDPDRLLSSIRSRCGEVDLFAHTDTLLGFAFKEHVVQYRDGSVSTQIAVMVTDKMVGIDKLEPALSQSWGFKGARQAIEKCRYTIVVTDLMSSSLDYKERLALFQKTLYSVIEQAPCSAIHWVNSQQIVDPEQYLLNNPDNEDYDILYGALNIRLFNISGPENAMLMDTMGLGALGLPDLQCHFKGLGTNAIAGLLYGYGDYIFVEGDAIEDGHTVQGLSSDQKWKCRHEISMAEPARVVLDIDPGAPHAAGGRN